MNDDNPMETIQDIKVFLEFARQKYLEDFKNLDAGIAEAKKDNDLGRFYSLIIAKARQEGGLQFVKVLKQEFMNKGGKNE
jgi:hypothetical protein